jgi:hypothetical protein
MAFGLTDNTPFLNISSESGALQEDMLKPSKSDSSTQR